VAATPLPLPPSTFLRHLRDGVRVICGVAGLTIGNPMMVSYAAHGFVKDAVQEAMRSAYEYRADLIAKRTSPFDLHRQHRHEHHDQQKAIGRITDCVEGPPDRRAPDQ
jgi:hypothetical protein